jgi:hypothetical protein
LLKKLLLFLCVALLVFAAPSQKLNSGIDALANQSYDKAYRIFYALFITSPSDLKINFFLGRSALEIGKLVEAQNAFERVLSQNPKHTRAALELARTLYLRGDLHASKALFIKITNTTKEIPPSVQKNIISYLEKIEDATTNHHFNAVVQLGAKYDSNILYLDPKYASEVLGDGKKESDMLNYQTLLANHIYSFSQQSNFILKNEALAYREGYNEHNNRDIFFSNFTSTLSHNGKNTQQSLALIYEKLQINRKDYLSTLGLSPSYSQYLFKTKHTMSLKYLQKKINNTHQKTTSKLNTYELLWQANLINHLMTSMVIGSDMSDADILAFYVRSYFYFTTNYDLILNPKNAINIGINYQNLHYDKARNATNEKRADTITTLSLKYNYTLNPLQNIQCGYDYRQSNSSLEQYQYDRHALSCAWMLHLRG